VGELRQRPALQIMRVQPEKLFRIENAGRLADIFKRELLGQLCAREYLLVAMRPAEPDEVVAERLGEIAHVAISRHRRRAVALAEARLVEAENQRHVREGRRSAAERLI